MAWIILLIAGLLEVVWAIGLKYTHGFTRLTPSIITIAAMVVSMLLLANAMKTLPAGTICGVDRHRRGGRGHHGHGAAGRVDQYRAYHQPVPDRGRHPRAEVQQSLIGGLLHPDQRIGGETVALGRLQ